MSSSLYEITVQHVDGREEKITCGWTYGPKNGVLHLHDVQTDWGTVSRAIVLANVVGYTEKRLR